MIKPYPRFLTGLLLVLAGVSANVHAQSNLVVEVRIEGQSASNQQELDGGIQGSGWGVQSRQRTVTRSSSNMQRLMVMDGGTATLSSLQTQPLRLRQVLRNPYGQIVSESYVFRSLGGSLRVTPRSRGGMVDIEVGTEEARPVAGQYSATEVLQLSTQIRGRLGEWLLLGDDQRGASDAGGGYAGGIGGGSAGAQAGGRGGEASSGQQIWLRVVAAP